MRETALNKGFLGKKAVCNCGGETTFTEVAHKVKAHNGYCYICPNCYKKAVLSKKGIFTTALIERQAKKDASHGVRIWEEVKFDALTEEERGYIVANYPMDRIGDLYVSTSKIGTWQLSKLADYIGSERIKACASKDGYRLEGSPELIIKAVRDISSNHGKLSARIIADYGFFKA